MMSVWTKFRSALLAFRVAQAGNVAITFAFATLPIIAFVGFAVDYSRANSVKAAMQAALDSTSLMLSKEASTDTATQLQTNAQNYFLALFTRTEAKNITVTANFTSGATAMIVTANAEVPTALLGIIGVNKINLMTSSTSKWGETRLRVALVLDNTGSMADAGKMAALQTATKSLADSIEECCHQQWRRLCLDHSVRKGRQSRSRKLEFGLHLLGDDDWRCAPRPDGIRQQILGCQQRHLSGQWRRYHWELFSPEYLPHAFVVLDFRLHQPERMH